MPLTRLKGPLSEAVLRGLDALQMPISSCAAFPVSAGELAETEKAAPGNRSGPEKDPGGNRPQGKEHSSCQQQVG